MRLTHRLATATAVAAALAPLAAPSTATALTAHPTASVTVKAERATKALPGATVEIKAYIPRTGDILHEVRTVTDRNGRFTHPYVAAGKVVVTLPYQRCASATVTNKAGKVVARGRTGKCQLTYTTLKSEKYTFTFNTTKAKS